MGRVDCIMADLGYSSMQIDDPQRGFTYKSSGPLDMRMNPTQNLTALDFLINVDKKDLIRILEENSDEIMSVQIATCLKELPIPTTTTQLSERVRLTMKAWQIKNGGPVFNRESLDSAVARTMQAIRIEVNGEFLVLEKLLDSLPRLLSPGGRVVFLTFHSGKIKKHDLSFCSIFSFLSFFFLHCVIYLFFEFDCLFICLSLHSYDYLRSYLFQLYFLFIISFTIISL